MKDRLNNNVFGDKACYNCKIWDLIIAHAVTEHKQRCKCKVLELLLLLLLLL